MFENWKLKIGNSVKQGFSAIEMVIVVAILVLIASVLLANFPNLGQRIQVQRSAQNLALAIRKAQNMALAVRECKKPPPDNTLAVPSAYGVYLQKSANTYIVFCDFQATGEHNGRYDLGYDAVVETKTLTNGVSISSLIFDLDGPNEGEVDPIHIAFTVPEARPKIQRDSPMISTGAAEITLSGIIAGVTKKIIVQISGQVYLK